LSVGRWFLFVQKNQQYSGFAGFGKVLVSFLPVFQGRFSE
jgi:hypothetical protein